VGSFPDGASWCGALDMAGNVLEWCLDWFDTLYYGESPDTDPTGPITGEYRAMRGGQYADPPHYIRSANRGSKFPELRHQGMGLRACITP
jgi:formylglycine-generating enzyme required for sulfatase activity